MNVRYICTQTVLVIFCVCALFSCKTDTKVDAKSTEEVGTIRYQCPMNCEQGKTYVEKVNCPVCKMDLAVIDSKKGNTCRMHKDGKCSCKGPACKCPDCKEHTNKITCTLHEDGKCVCNPKSCSCKNCADHRKSTTCNAHKGGKCSCDGAVCKCLDCKEHTKVMTCAVHTDGNCTCEGDSCKCANCPTHS
ncbi:heavy metal-binding domain-containing protein [Aquimarina pacifica]|uniref:heavy metal-binding domain-containing protein n=1 Tax=Aquimarina pacifica TaxID=1296415 RepID=UPI0013764F5B|nr:heavy metal-binding domain-containing protein [Aquimarina pacifica]